MHCYQAFLCYWDGYHVKKYNEPYSAQMVPTDPFGSWTSSVGVTVLGDNNAFKLSVCPLCNVNFSKFIVQSSIINFL